MGSLLIRSVHSDLEMRDGRTAYGRVIPYDDPAIVLDSNTGEPYTEGFKRGAFEGATKAPQKIVFQFTHEENFVNTIGWGEALEERDDGLWGAFRLTEADAPKARELLKNSHKGLSVGFVPIKSRRHEGIVWRVKAYLQHVAAVTDPAYAGAGIVAVRQNVTPEQVVETPNLDEVQEWLAKIKIGG